MAKAEDQRVDSFKGKAIWALLPYAIRLSGRGQQQMVGPLLRALRSLIRTNAVWHCIKPVMATLFYEPGTPSPDRVMTLASPYLLWNKCNRDTVTRWSMAALATLAVPHTEEVGQSVIDALWWVASVDTLRQPC